MTGICHFGSEFLCTKTNGSTQTIPDDSPSLPPIHHHHWARVCSTSSVGIPWSILAIALASYFVYLIHSKGQRQMQRVELNSDKKQRNAPLFFGCGRRRCRCLCHHNHHRHSHRSHYHRTSVDVLSFSFATLSTICARHIAIHCRVSTKFN